jgi:pterin-4a-carbinolamine dehydratase
MSAPATNATARKTPASSEDVATLVRLGWKVDQIPGLTVSGQKLKRNFQFKTFEQAWGFMNRVALASEKLNVG